MSFQDMGRGGGYQRGREALGSYSSMEAEASRLVRQFCASVRRLTKLVTQLGDSRRDTRAERAEIHSGIEQAKLQAKQALAALQQLGEQRSEDAGEQRRRRAQQAKMQSDMQGYAQKFTELCKLDLAKEKQQSVAGSRGGGALQAGDIWGEEEQRQQREQQAPSSANASLLREQQLEDAQLVQSELDFNRELAEERNREIREIESAVVEVNEIFRDLATMVDDQGLMVDHIESATESSAAATTQGVQDLHSAEQSQISARKKGCIIAIIVGVVVVVAVIVILFSIGVLPPKH